MSIRLILTFVIASACASCSSPETVKQKIYVDSACDSFQPIITHNKDAELMDSRTVREINSHNAIWDRICGEAK